MSPALASPDPVTPAPWGTSVPERRRVLLVDDEGCIRRSVGRFLQRAGYQVTAVSTGLEAVAALVEGPYDAVISDLRMPGLCGEDLFAKIQREFPAMTRRLIFTSGDMDRGETKAFLGRSNCPWLEKPYELTALIKVLTDLCLPAERSPSLQLSF